MSSSPEGFPEFNLIPEEVPSTNKAQPGWVFVKTKD